MLAPRRRPLGRWRRDYAPLTLAIALCWAVLLPAAHTLGHRNDHEHSPAGLIPHGFGAEHHDHPAGAGLAVERHGRHAYDDADHHDDHGGEAGAHGRLSRRPPRPPHGHGSLLHLGAVLLGGSRFVFTAELGRAVPAPVIRGVAAPRPSPRRSGGARAPPARRSTDV
jgi:hypothetical protein